AAYATDTCAPDCEAGDEGLYPHPQNCTLYYQCAFSHAVIEHCPPGLEFNPDLLYCDYPGSFECTADPDLDCGETTTPTMVHSTSQSPPTPTTSGIPMSSTPSSATEEQSSTTTSETTTPTMVHSTSSQYFTVSSATEEQSSTTTSGIFSETSTPVTENPSICFPSCPSTSATFANPKDCSTYFQCVGGIPYLLTCSSGEEFNPDAGTCQDADSFECTAGPDQPCVAV
ncbi:Chitin binding domain, partial [Trinorchestia longiramus]